MLIALGASSSAIIRRMDRADADYIAAAQGVPVAWVKYTTGDMTSTTAVLIRDKFLLAAGHTFRNGTHNIQIGNQVYNNVGWTINPTWTSGGQNFLGGYDFSVIRLDRRVTQFAPVPLRSSPLPDGTLLRIVGMGGTGLGNGTGYVYPWNPFPASWPARAMTNIAETDGAYQNLILTDFDSPAGNTNTLAGLGSIAAPTNLEGNVIFGDSGGPALRDTNAQGTAWEVVGVISFLSNSVQGTPNGDYGDLTGISRVSVAASWIMGAAWEAGRADGRVQLQDFVGSPTLRTATIQLRNPGSPTTLETYHVPLAVNGGFSFVTPLRGVFDLKFSIPGFCSRVLTNVTISNTGPGGLLVSLPNGDTDVSGEVDAADIDLIIAGFGQNTTSATQGDLDGSGEVDAADIDVVIANFGETSAN
jgi:hypothetical protein